ncbi:MAG TPA: DPP IV N-terminal domain-containing protein [Longimicrobiaceae bacterium]|nr:DPP IV N-terminal domain-containing protein [Longimicrobiaceae bacterium]
MKRTTIPALSIGLLTLLAAGCTDETAAPTAIANEARGVGEHGGGIPGSIVFVSERDAFPGEMGEIYAMNADGSSVTRLTFALPADDAWPAWSPNGKRIVFASDRSGDREIWAMNSDGTELVRLTHSAGPDAGGVYSPNGKQIAFHSRRDGNFELYVMDADGENPTRLTDHPGSDLWPDWSPNGKQIAFQRGFQGNEDIYVLDLRTGEERRLTDHRAPDRMPVFSPNGKQIVFMSGREGYCSIFVMDATGENLVNLTPKPAGVPAGSWCNFWPSWSRNGQQIYFASERPGTADVDVFVMNADGTGVRQLTNAPGWDYAPVAR